MASENPIIHMSHHIKPHHLPFQSPSEPGWGFKDVIEENYQLFQDTVPLDDAVALDSFQDETQCQIDFDTEVIEDTDRNENMPINPITELEKEVALDSEDELDCSVENFKGNNRISDFMADTNIKRNTIGFFKRFPCSSSLQLRGPLADQQCGTDARKTQVSAASNDYGADDIDKSSQENALDFIDSYLSQHEVFFSPKPKHREIREEVPPASGLKGCQNLAKQISNRNPDGKERTFEWDDGNHHEEIGFFEKNIGAAFGHNGSLQRPLLRHKKSGRIDSKESGVPTNQCLLSDSRNLTGFWKQKKNNEQICQMNFEKNQILVGEDLDAFYMETDTPDMFDVGISTQIAAEAMEALSNGLVIDKTVGQRSENLLVDPLTPVMKSKAHKGDFSNPRANARMSSQRKSSTTKRTSSSFLKHPSYQELDNEPEKTTKSKSSKFMDGRLKGRENMAPKERSTGQNLKPVKKRKKSEHASKYINEDQSSTLPFGNNSLGKQCMQMESSDHQTGNWMTEQILEGTKDESHDQGGRVNNVTKSSIITYKRKRSSLSNKPSMAEHRLVVGVVARTKDEANNSQERVKDTGKVCMITYQRKKSRLNAKLSEVSTAEQKNFALCMLTHHIQDGLESSSLTNSLCFNTWNYTKGKRSLRKRPRNSSAAKNQFDSIMVLDEKENYRRPSNKILPKSSILKELVRLGIPDQQPDFKWKNSRKRRDMANVKVLFSQHLDDDIIKQQKRILARRHISVASCSTDATHFVADKFVRTRNMLETIALGKPVVTHLWLESVAQTSCLVDEKNYILRDAKKEEEIGFTMPISLAQARQHPLLEGQRVLVTPNVKPDKDTVLSLVKAVGGQAIEKGQISILKKIPDDLLILSCEEDEDTCVPFLHKGAAVYSSELLLSGIIIQKLEYERHQLFKNCGKRNRQASKR